MAETTGMILRRLREAKKVTQTKMAEDIGLSQAAICAYENDERTPRDSIKIKIAKYLGRSVQFIFFS